MDRNAVLALTITARLMLSEISLDASALLDASLLSLLRTATLPVWTITSARSESAGSISVPSGTIPAVGSAWS